MLSCQPHAESLGSQHGLDACNADCFLFQDHILILGAPTLKGCFAFVQAAPPIDVTLLRACTHSTAPAIGPAALTLSPPLPWLSGPPDRGVSSCSPPWVSCASCSFRACPRLHRFPGLPEADPEVTGLARGRRSSPAPPGGAAPPPATMPRCARRNAVSPAPEGSGTLVALQP